MSPLDAQGSPPERPAAPIVATPLWVPGAHEQAQRSCRPLNAWTTAATIALELPPQAPSSAAVVGESTAPPSRLAREPHEPASGREYAPEKSPETSLDDELEVVIANVPIEAPPGGGFGTEAAPTTQNPWPQRSGKPSNDDPARLLGVMLPPLSDSGLCVRWSRIDGELSCSLIFQAMSLDRAAATRQARRLPLRAEKISRLFLDAAPTRSVAVDSSEMSSLLAGDIGWAGEFGHRSLQAPGLGCGPCDRRPGHCPADLKQILARLQLVNGALHLDVIITPDFDLLPSIPPERPIPPNGSDRRERRSKLPGFRVCARLLCEEKPDPAFIRAIADGLPFCRVNPHPVLREHRLGPEAPALTRSAAIGAPLGPPSAALCGRPLPIQQTVACLPWPERRSFADVANPTTATPHPPSTQS